MRILVFRVGHKVELEDSSNPFNHAKELIGGGYVESLTLEDGVVVYCDENGRHLGLPINRVIPARMPEFPSDMFVIDTRQDGGPPPGEMGVHRIYGNFLLTRHGEEDCIDLTDADIQKYSSIGMP